MKDSFKKYIKLFNDISEAIADKIDRKIKSGADIQSKINAMLFILALFTLFINISTCIKVYSNVPINERTSRVSMAKVSSWFYNSGPLEPVPVFALKVPMTIFKTDPVKLQRAEGCLVFVLIFFVFIKVLSSGMERSSALYGSVILAGVPWMGYYAMTGSAMLFALLFLLLYWDFSAPPRLSRKRAVYAGLCAAAACLSRTESIFFIIINTLFFIREYKISKAWKNLGIIFGLLFLLSSPYYIWQKAHYGNAFYGQEMGLTRLINAEILVTEKNVPFVEEPTSLYAFIVRDGLWPATLEPFKGLIRALSYEFPRAIYYKLAIFLSFLGFYFAFVKEKKFLYSLWLSAFIPVCFIADMYIIRDQGGIQLEYYLASLPGIMAAAGYGLQELCKYAISLINKYYNKGGK